MKKINRLKYTGIVAGVGLAVVMFGSGAYANTRENAAEPQTEETEEIEAINFNEVAGINIENPEDATAEDNTDVNSAVDNETEGDNASDNKTEGDNAADNKTEGDNAADNKTEGDNTADNETGDDNASDDQSQDKLRLTAGFEEDINNAINEVIESNAAEKEAADNEKNDAEAEEAAVEPEKHWGYTNLGIAHVDNHLNIREEPNENGKLIGKLSKDAACEILDIDENGWAHIKSGKVDGYCSTEFLYMGDAAIARGREVASMIAIVNTQTLKVREEPNTDSIVITLIPQEEELEVVEVMDNGWIKFLLDDEEAYVSGEYVDVEERLEKAVTLTELLYGQGVSNVRVDLVQYAKQFVGNPYVWGGTSLTGGADCSGFTLSIYKKYGVSLPHHAASQAQLGTKVSLNEIQPGDLVFYAKNGSINHVAIYIGNGQVIHASSPKTGIKISGVNYRTPACARRYLSV